MGNYVKGDGGLAYHERCHETVLPTCDGCGGRIPANTKYSVDSGRNYHVNCVPHN